MKLRLALVPLAMWLALPWCFAQETRVATTVNAQNTPAPTPPNVKPAVLKEHATKKVKPVYPPSARAAHVGGEVVVGVEVDETGRLTKLGIVSGPEMLRLAALDAARRWEFKPVEVDGAPTTVRSTIQFDFIFFTGGVTF